MGTGRAGQGWARQGRRWVRRASASRSSCQSQKCDTGVAPISHARRYDSSWATSTQAWVPNYDMREGMGGSTVPDQCPTSARPVPDTVPDTVPDLKTHGFGDIPREKIKNSKLLTFSRVV